MLTFKTMHNILNQDIFILHFAQLIPCIIGYVNEYPTMHYFEIATLTPSVNDSVKDFDRAFLKFQ